MTDAERVRFLLQPQGVAALEAYLPSRSEREALLTQALGEYQDARLAAAYVLDVLCANLQGQATAPVKRIKIEGIEVEREPQATSSADRLCARATALRREVRRERRGVTLTSPIQVPR